MLSSRSCRCPPKASSLETHEFEPRLTSEAYCCILLTAVSVKEERTNLPFLRKDRKPTLPVLIGGRLLLDFWQPLLPHLMKSEVQRMKTPEYFRLFTHEKWSMAQRQRGSHKPDLWGISPAAHKRRRHTFNITNGSWEPSFPGAIQSAYPFNLKSPGSGDRNFTPKAHCALLVLRQRQNLEPSVRFFGACYRFDIFWCLNTFSEVQLTLRVSTQCENIYMKQQKYLLLRAISVALTLLLCK